MRNKGGKGTQEDPWKNLSWALYLLQSCVNEASVYSSKCKPRLVLNCTGTAYYSAVAFGASSSQRYYNGVNIVIRNMNLQIERTEPVRGNYSILYAECAYLMSCSIRHTYSSSQPGMCEGHLVYLQADRNPNLYTHPITYGCVVDSSVYFVQAEQPLYRTDDHSGTDWGSRNALGAYVMYNSEVTFTGSSPERGTTCAWCMLNCSLVYQSHIYMDTF